MTKKSLQSAAASTAPHGGNLTPQQQNEQALLLEPFYERLIGMNFDQSATAIERCRDLCAEYGFTVKQEASTHRNIYVYCSREGLPDSLRNPKSNPQRKRPSKRCDCRWRVVLYENESSKWEFRKSLNPEAGKHNHELMRPEDIERSWPKEVTDLICELARLRMTTQDIRGRVRDQFPNIHWNERRFYNRLSEERQKIKLRDSIDRTHQLSDLWSKVCMATAGNDDLFQFVKQELVMLFQSICETVQIDSQTFPAPYIFRDDNDNDAASESSAMDPSYSHAYERPEVRRSSSRSSTTTTMTAGKGDNAPKGYIAVEIPKQIYYIKIHNQRQLHETQLIKTQHRTRTLSEDQSAGEPLRKQARKGKGRQLTYNDDNRLPPDTTMQHDSLPLMGHSSSPYPTNSQRPPSSMNSSRHQPQLQQPATTFVYSYESNMGLDTSLTGYVNPSFQSNYAMAANSPSTPGFNAPDMSFTFDPQQHSPIGRNSADSSNSSANNNNNSSNEPTIHPALHSNPMSSHHQQQQQQQSHRGGSITPPNVQQHQAPQQPSTPNAPNAGNGSNQGMYSMSPSGNKSQLGISPNTGTTSMMSRSILPSVEQQQPYHPQQPQQQQGLFMRQSPPQQAPHHRHHHHQHHPHAMQQPPTPTTSHHHHASSAGSILPLYQQQQTQQQHQHHPPPSSEPRNS
ncbi:uncharacterized protein ATC70_006734 [Mucor velutinosus]|uniref:FAR1 domain-containing protein n=1 Tax=Mucor velutinosus TaxID=708070 RepID=A0AAN7I3M5_9FUNG|nr:hypothetical protein ATC70_006734 [Mucor velutinosus]